MVEGTASSITYDINTRQTAVMVTKFCQSSDPGAENLYTHIHTHTTHTHVPTDCLKRKLNCKTINRKILWFAHILSKFSLTISLHVQLWPVRKWSISYVSLFPNSTKHYETVAVHTHGVISAFHSTLEVYAHGHTHTHTCANRLPEQEAKPQDNQLQNSMVCALSANLAVLFHYTCNSGLSRNEAVLTSTYFQIPPNTVRQLQSTSIHASGHSKSHSTLWGVHTRGHTHVISNASQVSI